MAQRPESPKGDTEDRNLFDVKDAAPSRTNTHEASAVLASSAPMASDNARLEAENLEMGKLSIVANGARKSAALQRRAVWKAEDAERAEQKKRDAKATVKAQVNEHGERQAMQQLDDANLEENSRETSTPVIPRHNVPALLPLKQEAIATNKGEGKGSVHDEET